MSLGDVLLRPEDTSLLHAPNWLNDICLSFFIEHLLILYERIMARVLLISPSVSFFLAQSQSQADADGILQTLDVGSKELVLFAVNDHTSIHTIGGNHWTLLVFVRQTLTFRHYDSSPGRSSRNASARLVRQVQNSLAPGLECTLTQVDLMPQQENGWDCGAYVLKMMELICEWYAAAGSTFDLESHDEELGNLLSSQSIAEFRCHMLDLVEQYR